MSDALCARLRLQEVPSGTALRFSSESIDLDPVIVEILSRLPAKSLLRFRCVCKAWRALISDPYFIRKHLSCINTRASTSYSLLLREQVFRSIEHEAVLKHLSQTSDGPPLPFRRPRFPVLDPTFDITDIEIVGSCNGLICLMLDYEAKESYTFMLWNPCTGESNLLPQPPIQSSSSFFWGFGYDSTIDDYKVVLGSCISGHEVVVVFRLKMGSWRKVERLERSFDVRWVGCLVNESLHWVFKEVKECRLIGQKIVSFDLAEEKFHEIPFPYPLKQRLIAEVENLDICLTQYFQTNCCQPGCNFKMWVVSDYEVKESGTEVIKIPVLDAENMYMTCISENGEGLMRVADDGSLALYNPKEKAFRIVMNGDHWYETASYLETLVSPSTGSIGASV